MKTETLFDRRADRSGTLSWLKDEFTPQAVQDAGFQYFDWNVDSNDAGGAISQGVISGNVIGGVMNQNVSIVLQHDIYANSVNAVEDIILWGLSNGYRFEALQTDSPAFHHPVLN